MSEPIDDLYLNWLYAKVASIEVPPTPSVTYWTLLTDLHSTEFTWLMSGDDNRAQDGLELRNEFMRETHLEPDQYWMDEPCSVLEMLIAFSRRASFETEYTPKEWFWMMLDNLDLGELSDAHLGVTRTVEEVTDRLIWRTYDADGDGGLFPLITPEHDQRKVEIWYQFCEYLVDHDLL